MRNRICDQILRLDLVPILCHQDIYLYQHNILLVLWLKTIYYLLLISVKFFYSRHIFIVHLSDCYRLKIVFLNCTSIEMWFVSKKIKMQYDYYWVAHRQIDFVFGLLLINFAIRNQIRPFCLDCTTSIFTRWVLGWPAWTILTFDALTLWLI